MLVDTHAHLEAVDDFEEALKRAKKAGVNKLISIGTNLEESKNAIRLAEKYSKDGQQVFATCGIHPNDGKRNVNNNGLEETIKKLRLIARASKKVIAIGECGLDYYDSTREEQKKFKENCLLNKSS